MPSFAWQRRSRYSGLLYDCRSSVAGGRGGGGRALASCGRPRALETPGLRAHARSSCVARESRLLRVAEPSLTLAYGDSYIGVMRIDRADSTLVFEQVAAEIRRAILDGEARPGERLPPAKGVSVN